MAYIRSEEEAGMMIEEMKRKTKGKYITQGVTFNKESQRQMELLKYALMYSSSFSALCKEMLAAKLEGVQVQQVDISQMNHAPVIKKDVGNFSLD